MQTKDYQLRGVKVRYVEAEGPSPSIVFLHGVTDSLTSYLAPMSMLGGEFRMLAGFNADEALAKIESPVHLLAGAVSLGGAVEQRDVERLASVVRRYTHRMLPGVGHMIHHTAPADYVSEVRAFAGACVASEQSTSVHVDTRAS